MRTFLTSFAGRWENTIISYKNFFFATTNRTHRSCPVCCINMFHYSTTFGCLGAELLIAHLPNIRTEDQAIKIFHFGTGGSEFFIATLKTWSAIFLYTSRSFLVAGPSSAAADSLTVLYCVLMYSYSKSWTTAALATSKGEIKVHAARGTLAKSVM